MRSHPASSPLLQLGVRILVIALRSAALVTTAWALISRADCVFATTCRATNLLSYFTIQSNIAFVLLTTLLIIWMAIGRPETPWLTTIRAIVTSYLVISGVTFAILMETAGLGEFAFLVPFSSKVLHFVVPVSAVIDFALFPGRRRVPLHRAFWALLYPLAYSILTAIRGSSLNWYPYVFFDPEWVGGYAGVLAYAAVLAAALVAVAAALILVTRLPTPAAASRSASERG